MPLAGALVTRSRHAGTGAAAGQQVRYSTQPFTHSARLVAHARVPGLTCHGGHTCRGHTLSLPRLHTHTCRGHTLSLSCLHTHTCHGHTLSLSCLHTHTCRGHTLSLSCLHTHTCRGHTLSLPCLHTHTCRGHTLSLSCLHTHTCRGHTLDLMTTPGHTYQLSNWRVVIFSCHRASSLAACESSRLPMSHC